MQFIRSARQFLRLSTLVSLFITLSAVAANEAPISTAQAAFERLKGLAGEWHGRVGNRETGSEATVTYKVTAGGNTLMETLFPGTPHEMVTMYYLEEGKLVLTHYCAAGNQPRMALTKQSTEFNLEFKFIGGANIKSRRDGHMHAARIHLLGRNHLESEWDYFENGKIVDTKKFFLTRKS